MDHVFKLFDLKDSSMNLLDLNEYETQYKIVEL